MDAVIEVKGLVKKFGTLTAVDGVSFQVNRGEIFGMLGPNGAGKTTTLEIMEGLQPSTAGQTLVLGVDTQKSPEKVKAKIGIQLQASAYYDYLTLTEILNLFSSFYKKKVDPDSLLKKVNLTDKRNSTLGKLSGGQKQRFTIIASLVNDPEIVFLDEPTTGLDPQARHHLWDVIQQIHRDGKTIVLTTHYMEEAERLCERVAIMDMGRIVAMDTPPNLVRKLQAPYYIHIVPKASGNLDGMAKVEGVTGMQRLENGSGYMFRAADAATVLPRLFAWAGESGVAFEHIEVQPATLEDVFLTLTGKSLRE